MKSWAAVSRRPEPHIAGRLYLVPLQPLPQPLLFIYLFVCLFAGLFI